MSTASRSVLPIPVSDLQEDEQLRMRAELEPDVVREYAQRMKAGDSFPPVLVFAIDDAYYLIDGYHRVAATMANHADRVVCEVRRGTRQDAIWAGCGLNRAHGLRRTNADKRRAVERAIQHPKGQKLSDRQLAQHCGVHHDTVGRIRRELEHSGAIRHIDERLVFRAGAPYLQRVESIGRSNASRAREATLGASPTSEAPTTDVQPPLVEFTVATLATIASMVSKLERELSALAGELDRRSCEGSLPDLSDARGDCLRIQKALQGLSPLLRGPAIARVSPGKIAGTPFATVTAVAGPLRRSG